MNNDASKASTIVKYMEKFHLPYRGKGQRGSDQFAKSSFGRRAAIIRRHKFS